jgi:hypothetical protein
MTLVEVTLAMAILALMLGGVLATLIQTRRLTEGSVSQNSALTIVQGYVEQMKNMDLKDVVNSPTDPASGGVPDLDSPYYIPTRLKDPPVTGADDGLDALLTSTGTPPSLSLLTPGVTPAANPSGSGVIKDNLKNFSDTSEATGIATTWAAIWPGRQNDPVAAEVTGTTYTPRIGNLHLNMWVWVQDLSGSTAFASKVYGITVIYTWQFQDGSKTRYVMGTVRSIRSAVPTY